MCIFCEISDFVLENELAGAFYDKFPVNEGHLLSYLKIIEVTISIYHKWKNKQSRN